jgi:hypothetical protein
MQTRQLDKKPVATSKGGGKEKAAAPVKPAKVAFPKQNRPPTAAAFAARLPLALGKRFEMVRSFLLRQKDVKEDVSFYGPKTGWAMRYLIGGKPLCVLLLHGDAPVGIVSLTAAAAAAVSWKGLSAYGQLAYKHAHGSPAMLWLDVPLAQTGAADFKTILRAKIASTTAS